MDKPCLVFGFGYRSRSGKDTAVAEIVKQRKSQYDVRRYAFADELKKEVNQAVDAFPAGQRDIRLLWDENYHLVREDGVMVQLRDYPWVQYEPDAPMDDPMCPYGKQRTLLQWWGTEFRRNVNPNYWITKLSKQLKKDRPEIALIADMRFKNEFDWMDERFCIARGSLGVITPQMHISDRELSYIPDDQWTRILPNDGSLEEFQKSAVEAFDTVMEFYPKGYGLV